jgi:drug/metabolite transporter (DMT)-like permease
MSRSFVKWFLFVILCIIWGSSFKLMKDSTAGLTASQIAALRIFSAGIVFVPFSFFHYTKVPKPQLGRVILSAVFGNLLPAFLFAIAMTRLDGSLGGILNSLTPLCVAVIGILFFNVRISMRKITGILTGFAGLVLLTVLPVFTGDRSMEFDNLGYSLLVLLATFLYGINVNMVSHRIKGVNPVHIATVSLAFMTIPTFIVLWMEGFFQVDFNDKVVREAIIASAGLGIVGSAIATALFYMLVKRAGGLFASLVTYGIPFIALLWGVFDKEKITWLQVICLGIILLGVYLANRPEQDEKAA